MAATQPFCTSLPALKLIWGIFRSVFPGQSTGRESRLPALRGSLGATGGLALAAQLRAAVSVGGGHCFLGPLGERVCFGGGGLTIVGSALSPASSRALDILAKECLPVSSSTTCPQTEDSRSVN